MKQFIKKDEEFICINCRKEVIPLGYTSRNHCPNCLYSLHVDVFPGDRQNQCKGMLKPVGIEKHKDSFKIIHKCLKCGDLIKNIKAEDDDYNLIISLSKGDNI